MTVDKKINLIFYIDHLKQPKKYLMSVTFDNWEKNKQKIGNARTSEKQLRAGCPRKRSSKFEPVLISSGPYVLIVLAQSNKPTTGPFSPASRSLS
jgi:hypothetical protein